MIAYEFRDGVAVPCENVGPVRRISYAAPPVLAVQPLYYSKRERRQIARRGTRGRRGAKSVPRQPPMWTPERVEVQRGHLLRAPFGNEALLYLPEGVDVTEEHCRAR